MKATAVSRGAQTRDALLKAATRVFGQAGFDAASTRAIADAANANLALIQYHFGGKEGLYQAVIEMIAAEIDQSLSPTLNQLEGELPLEPVAARQAIFKLLSFMIDEFGRQEMQDWSRIIAREQQDPTAGFEIIYQRFMRRILESLTALVVSASANSLQGEEARLRATFFFGQVLVFIYAPAATSRYLGWESLDAKQRNAIREQLQAVVHSQFREFTQ